MDIQLNHEGGHFLHYHHHLNFCRSLQIIKPQKSLLGQQKINLNHVGQNWWHEITPKSAKPDFKIWRSAEISGKPNFHDSQGHSQVDDDRMICAPMPAKILGRGP